MKKENIENNAVTIISEGVVLDGKLSSKGNIRIDGMVKGDVSAGGNVTIGERGEINGQVNAAVIIIGGKVMGTVIANEKIILESSSVLKGDLVTKILIVEEGALFDGKSSMNGKEKSDSLLSGEMDEK
ncbi:MAG: polymer-forming cytoskeletal protein [Bacteroidetes bacterium]|nr:polymer-forming cytoskeletal protein [Bacteroidota bacterium]